MNFRPSRFLSVGAEFELQILNSETLDLEDGILPLMKCTTQEEFIKPEVLQNTVEIVSRVCLRASEVEWHLRSLAREVIEHGDRLGLRFCGAGTHPFHSGLANITPDPRYLRMEVDEGYVIRAQIAFATHVHVGVRSAGEMIATVRELRAYLPILMAVSGNSPFYRGHPTGHACFRQRLLAASQTYGLPPVLSGPREFEELYGALTRSRAIGSIRDLHWDIRPRPDLGTVEVRAMDAQETVTEVAMLAAFVRVLVAYLRSTPCGRRPASLPRELHSWLERENAYQAAHLGLAAPYIRDDKGEVVPLVAVFGALMGELAPHFRTLGEWEYFERLTALPRTGAGFDRQLRTYAETGSVQKVVSDLAERLEEDCGLGLAVRRAG